MFRQYTVAESKSGDILNSVLLNFTRNCDINEYIAIEMTHILRQSEETDTTDEPVDAYTYSFQSQIRGSE